MVYEEKGSVVLVPFVIEAKVPGRGSDSGFLVVNEDVNVGRCSGKGLKRLEVRSGDWATKTSGKKDCSDHND